MADSEKDLVEAEQNTEEASNEQIRDEVEKKIRKEIEKKQEKQETLGFYRIAEYLKTEHKWENYLFVFVSLVVMVLGGMILSGSLVVRDSFPLIGDHPVAFAWVLIGIAAIALLYSLPLPNTASPSAATFASLFKYTFKPVRDSTKSLNIKCSQVNKLGLDNISPLSWLITPGEPIPIPLIGSSYLWVFKNSLMTSHNSPIVFSGLSLLFTSKENRSRITPLSVIDAPLMEVPPISIPIAIIDINISF